MIEPRNNVGGSYLSDEYEGYPLVVGYDATLLVRLGYVVLEGQVVRVPYPAEGVGVLHVTTCSEYSEVKGQQVLMARSRIYGTSSCQRRTGLRSHIEPTHAHTHTHTHTPSRGAAL